MRSDLVTLVVRREEIRRRRPVSAEAVGAPRVSGNPSQASPTARARFERLRAFMIVSFSIPSAENMALRLATVDSPKSNRPWTAPSGNAHLTLALLAELLSQLRTQANQPRAQERQSRWLRNGRAPGNRVHSWSSG